MHLQLPRELLHLTVFPPHRSRKINTAERFTMLVLEEQLYNQVLAQINYFFKDSEFNAFMKYSVSLVKAT